MNLISPSNPLFVACDHGGVELKNHLLQAFPELPWQDLGSYNSESVDYPEYAARLADKIKSQTQEAYGVLICGSGQGMAIKANRYPHIRAALCWDKNITHLSRRHNNANVLCLGGRILDLPTAQIILKEFLNTAFEGGRHQRRVDKL